MTHCVLSLSAEVLSLCSRAGCTSAWQCEVAGFQDKACGLGNRCPAGVQDIGGDVSHGSALLAQQVEIGVVGEVIDGSAVTEVDVVDDRKIGQRIEGSVDG